jgi:tetraacyldisaccharide 4'-kinase
VSSAFRFLLQAREKLYSSGILTTFRLHHPVISVGNLTVGGTGKTPLVITLARGLRDRGFRPVVLSRGYGRLGRGVLVVGDDASGWEEWGDEPVLIKRRLDGIPVVVAVNRYEGGLLAERQQLGNIFVLDDGFQHRRLHRDVDIVTIDPVEWASGELLLPAGRWREPKASVARAHVACVQEVPGSQIPSLPIPSFSVRTEIEGIYREHEQIAADSFKNHAVVAFAGIAKPERFFAAIESLGIHPTKRVRFRDHHRYSSKDIESLDGEMLITTEKDAVRLATVTNRPYSHLRISAKIPDFDDMMSLIMSALNCSGAP